MLTNPAVISFSIDRWQRVAKGSGARSDAEGVILFISELAPRVGYIGRRAGKYLLDHRTQLNVHHVLGRPECQTVSPNQFACVWQD